MSIIYGGVLSEDWKKASVTPIQKGYWKSPSTGKFDIKILETVIRDVLLDHVTLDIYN